MKLRIATRKSALALVQTRAVAERIRAHAPHVTIEELQIVTTGDRITDRPLSSVGGKGLFVGEVEAAVVRGEADLAVHSLKDVPGDQDFPPGLGLVCIPEREDPHDVLLSKDGTDIASLPRGCRVGTSSLRRSCQLRARRPDLQFVTLRGNVETRLRKLDEGQYEAIVLAAAGLRRLGLLEQRAHWPIPTDVCLPAAGQGTLAIEGRLDDARVLELLAPLEHARTRIETEAERAFLRTLEGNCKVPIAGHARFDETDSRLILEGMVASVDGERVLSGASERYIRGRNRAEDLEAARTLGKEVAEGLQARGATALMREAEAIHAQHEHAGNGGRKF